MSIQKSIINAYKTLEERGWDTIYWVIDLHGTCIKNSYKHSDDYEFINPAVKKALQYISSLPESKIIIWSSIYSVYYPFIDKFFLENNIQIDSFNCNPYIDNTYYGDFSNKFYFSIGIDDKFGFDPDKDWDIVLETLYSIKLNKELRKEFSLYDIINDIGRVSKIEDKTIPLRIVKFNEEFGEFCTEILKFEGFTYKTPDLNNLIEEAADSFQVLTSIILQLLKQHNVPFYVFLEKLSKKNIKWEQKIKEYANKQ